MNYLKTIYILLCCTLVLGACSDDDENSGLGALSITTPTYANVTYNKVTLSATISGSEGIDIIKRGFCYSTTSQPDVYDATAEMRGSDISATLTGLNQQTTYYARAFVSIYNEEPQYSEEITFTTRAETLNDELATYEAPTYADNYVNMAGWDKRSQWNLANVHDPTVMKADDGYYYMYQTDASYGGAHEGHGHFHGRRSKDLVNWEYLGATMNEAPGWVKTKLNEYRAEMGLEPIANPVYGFWAPVVRKVKSGVYRMYYSIVINNYIQTGLPNTEANFDNSWTERSFIGMMETSDPAGNQWIDKGMVVCSSSDKGTNWSRPNLDNWTAYFKWNAIDPSFVITPNNEHWLIYGSWHSGIVAALLNPETGMTKNTLGTPWGNVGDIANYGTLIATRDMRSRWQGSEAPEVIYNPQTGYYYLFLAYDGLDVPYNTRVVRSQNITGPYVGIDGVNVTQTGGNALPVVTHPYKFNHSDGWVGIAHCAIFDDGNGNWFYASQGRLPHNVPGINASNAVMMGQVRSIRWDANGWPVVMPERYGAVPQAPITEEELIGNWEHIDLSYSYEKQKTATVMTLGSNHKITSGTWVGGNWSYDADSQALTANGVTLYLQREVDWEAIPRTHTIVYAGYTNTKTYWGKRVQAE